MIEVDHLTRTFGDLVAVDDLSLRVRDGEVFGFLGPNGAGKTTTVRMLCCLISPTSGEAYVNGLDIRDATARLRIRGMYGLLPETPGLYEPLSAYRNLDFFARIHGIPEGERRERIKDLLQTLGVWGRRDDPISSFSKGMRQKIAIARALVHRPELLFLDEPTSGLDPQAALTVRNYLLELKKEGRTIFINTHNLADAEKLCDTVGVIRTRLLATGRPEELASRFYGRTTVVHLDTVTPQMEAAVSALPSVTGSRAVDDKLIIEVDSPEESNPQIVEALVRTGARIRFVNELRHGLEDVYMRLVGEL